MHVCMHYYYMYVCTRVAGGWQAHTHARARIGWGTAETGDMSVGGQWFLTPKGKKARGWSEFNVRLIVRGQNGGMAVTTSVSMFACLQTRILENRIKDKIGSRSSSEHEDLIFIGREGGHASPGVRRSALGSCIACICGELDLGFCE
jgi:hypothetical protein